MPQDKLHRSVQESIVTAVALVTDNNSIAIADQVKPEYFDAPYDRIILRCQEHRHRYKRAPGREHIDDIFADVLENDRHRDSDQYRYIIGQMIRQSDGLDTGYVKSLVTEFINLRLLRTGIAKAADRYNKGDGDVIGDVKEIFHSILREEWRDR